MIFDILDNADRYLPLNTGFARAFEFLKRPDLAEMAEGRYELDGERVYAMVSRDAGRKKDEAPLETHEKYIDIQLVLAGRDEMGWQAKQVCRQALTEYDDVDDIQFFAGMPEVWLNTQPGMFAIFFPEDAHLPLISSGLVHKVVVKVAVE
ncbi:YhcH/YjgK/YiaL family protein [Desulfotalea psychrophila]|uniref:Beta-D-galactosidase n=1 Tax=Desulfotalea psychrophila (strain LSv54 / DSM 12343) TaxID=177439 RepID=Q6AKK0_DESPS|nr:YhcH/YjgK/YiaL family protein [Desulfotalea psychrophila]CAG37125.1 hypothetical protein DP2396 [Desulfotalea psychrophila LSv54]